eukprot:918217-Prorocentrum_minimum.AAC.3
MLLGVWHAGSSFTQGGIVDAVATLDSLAVRLRLRQESYPFFIIPSLGNKEASGAYTLTVHADVPLTIELVEDAERTCVAQWEELGIQAIGSKHHRRNYDDDDDDDYVPSIKRR